MLAKKVEELSLNPDFPADAKGIPKFWLHVLKNGNEEALMGLVEEHDEVVLENLTNITVALDLDNAGFTLTFHFKDNDFFTNKVVALPLGPKIHLAISISRLNDLIFSLGSNQALQAPPRTRLRVSSRV